MGTRGEPAATATSESGPRVTSRRARGLASEFTWQGICGTVTVPGDPCTVRYLAVGAVVLGHVIAVYAARRLALMHLGDRRAAAISRLPLLVLMIACTVLSLWLFAQPTVETG